MKEYTTDFIRNIALVSHSGAGKTMLAEALLHLSGATTRLGKIEDGTTVSDFEEEEIRRSLSLSTSIIPVEYKDHKVNLLDTPRPPATVVPSMVEYVAGPVLAQLGNPDMRTPIAHALGFPERIESGARPLDVLEMQALSFERPDARRFPCMDLAYQALRAGGSAPVGLNAANEVAVDCGSWRANWPSTGSRR